MVWSKFFKSQSYNQPTWKHRNLPIYQTKEFDFFRCVEFNPSFYGKTVSELFNGNLRCCEGRYSCLFPNQKISYWADSPDTAKAEIKKHGAGSSILTFWAYDDPSSFIPCLGDQEDLIIVDGRECGIQCLIDKVDEGKEITKKEKEFLDSILSQEIDCIAYDSKARTGGENFIFLERGFKKLFLKRVSLRFSKKDGGAQNSIECAVSCDYRPYPKEYGKYFAPKCRIKFRDEYLASDEYKTREFNINAVFKRKFEKK